MKKYFFVLAFFVCNYCNVNAQELTKQMLNIYFGQPKTLVQSNNMSSETMTIEFDRSGRILSKSFGGGEMVYNWSSDGKSVEVKAYNNGQYMGSGMIYIEIMTSSQYRYTSNGAIIEVSLRDNGSINNMTMSGGGQSMTTTYYYNSSTEAYPYKIVMAGGGQSMTANISGVSKDSQGNWIKCTQSAQGQSVITTNTITYY